MLKSTQLIPLQNILLPDTSDYNIEMIERFLNDNMDRRLSVSIARNEVLFDNPSGSITEPCIMIYHPDHMDDYYQYVIVYRTKHLEIPVLSYCKYGVSKNKDEDIEAVKGGIYQTIVRGFMRNTLDVDSENQWYYVVENTLKRLAKAIYS